MSAAWLVPDWPAPRGIRAATTLRAGGTSGGVFASLNLGAHVGDDPHRVAANRQIIRESLALPAEPLWLEQVHGTRMMPAKDSEDRRADGSYTRETGVVCAVMTADCLPVLLCDRAGTRVAAVHAGWRGLQAGVLEAAVAALGTTEVLAWLGPAIGPKAFEVGEDVRLAFLDRTNKAADAFLPGADGKWLADLYTLARLLLGESGIDEVYGGDHCTHGDPERFFSYRRDGQTGRMASLIWRE